MRASSFVAPLFFAASSLAQAVPEGIEPSSPAPDGCETTVTGKFTIGVENFFSAKSKRETAQEASDGALQCTLEDGILRDQYSRTGSVVANRQFQFDGPPQAGAIYTGGFSVCQNKSLAIGGSTRWWRCMSGAFGNLYDESIGDQCSEIRIIVDFVDKPSPSSSLVPSSSSTLSMTPTGGAGVTLSSSASLSPATPSSASNSSASFGSSASSSRAESSGSATGSTSGSVTGSASSTPSPTTGGAAPPASAGIANSPIVQTTFIGALLAVFGAALVL
ncbi:hypothetical protein E8E12_008404 [Didymella heteroderae]|uniref:Cell wall mannoprotein PIR1-like C-terminal domain-containing protein n=1 Tax=Didymella heteroderae TaxID=1769908 RepID=A0A9P5C358_9PLEO|nr:hypothetical protein E8E12_008404 [Didymella heteroderae]